VNCTGNSCVASVEWDPSEFLTGLHDLNVYVGGAEKPVKSMQFSLDGSTTAFSSVRNFVTHALHTALLTTDFTGTGRFLCYGGILFSLCTLLFSNIVDAVRRLRSRWISDSSSNDANALPLVVLEMYNQSKGLQALRPTLRLILVLLGVWLLFGPLIVVDEIVTPKLRGSVSLSGVTVNGTFYDEAGDVYFSLLLVIWRIYIPAVWLVAIDAYDEVCHRTPGLVRHTLVHVTLIVISVLLWLQTLAWSLELIGAYGWKSAFFSPICMPLVFFVAGVSLLVLRNQIRSR